MRFVDLFAGLGGFHLAASVVGGECVFASELDLGLRSLYHDNFSIHPVGDIRGVDVEVIPAHDLLCAGFPCQPFSKAGDQAGWNDAVRGTLFGRVEQILARHRPKFVLLENVANFAHHDRGGSYARVRSSLEELGYGVRAEKLSPHHFGVPHQRDRLFIAARLGGLDGYEFPKPACPPPVSSIDSILDPDPVDAIRINARSAECLEFWAEFLRAIPSSAKLPSFPIWGMEFGATYPFDGDSLHSEPIRRLRRSLGSFGASLKRLDLEKILPLVPSHARAESGAFPAWKKDFIRQNRAFYSDHRGTIDPLLPRMMAFPSSFQKLEWNCQGEERDLWKYIIQFRASGVRVKRRTAAPSLVAMTGTQVPVLARERRYLTIRECARLQSMGGLEKLPRGERGYAALGNAVNVLVATRILTSLVDYSAENPSRARTESKPPAAQPANEPLGRSYVA